MTLKNFIVVYLINYDQGSLSSIDLFFKGFDKWYYPRRQRGGIRFAYMSLLLLIGIASLPKNKVTLKSLKDSPTN